MKEEDIERRVYRFIRRHPYAMRSYMEHCMPDLQHPQIDRALRDLKKKGKIFRPPCSTVTELATPFFDIPWLITSRRPMDVLLGWAHWLSQFSRAIFGF
jgi:hypothetical protein